MPCIWRRSCWAASACSRACCPGPRRWRSHSCRQPSAARPSAPRWRSRGSRTSSTAPSSAGAGSAASRRPPAASATVSATRCGWHAAWTRDCSARCCGGPATSRSCGPAFRRSASHPRSRSSSWRTSSGCWPTCCRSQAASEASTAAWSARWWPSAPIPAWRSSRCWPIAGSPAGCRSSPAPPRGSRCAARSPDGSAPQSRSATSRRCAARSAPTARTRSRSPPELRAARASGRGRPDPSSTGARKPGRGSRGAAVRGIAAQRTRAALSTSANTFDDEPRIGGQRALKTGKLTLIRKRRRRAAARRPRRALALVFDLAQFRAVVACGGLLDRSRSRVMSLEVAVDAPGWRGQIVEWRQVAELPNRVAANTRCALGGVRLDPVRGPFNRDTDEPNKRAVLIRDHGFAHGGEERRLVPAAHPELALPAPGPTHAIHDVLGNLGVLGAHRELGDWPPDHLGARPAVEPLSSGAPVRDRAGEVGGDDGKLLLLQQSFKFIGGDRRPPLPLAGQLSGLPGQLPLGLALLEPGLEVDGGDDGPLGGRAAGGEYPDLASERRAVEDDLRAGDPTLAHDMRACPLQPDAAGVGPQVL